MVDRAEFGDTFRLVIEQEKGVLSEVMNNEIMSTYGHFSEELLDSELKHGRKCVVNHLITLIRLSIKLMR